MTISMEINALFLKELPVEFATIQDSYHKKNYNEVQNLIHRLYGALCYCDFPELKKIAGSLKQVLMTNNILEIEKSWSLFECEVQALLSKHS